MDVKKTEGRTPETQSKVVPAVEPGRFLGLRDDLDRMFDNFLLTPFTRRLLDIDPFRRRGLMASDVTPRMDVVETDDAIEVSAELPGLTEADIDISLGEGAVTIRGEKRLEHEEKKGDYHLSERSFGTFTRSFRLPENVDEDKIEAVFDKGVLTLTMPKTEKNTPPRKKIEVKARN